MPLELQWVRNTGDAIVIGGVDVSISPAVDSVTDTTILVDATTGEATTLYVAVYADGTLSPGAQAVIDGTGAVATATASLSIGVEGAATVSGLTESTAYEVFAVLQDGNGNRTLVYELSATTDATATGLDFSALPNLPSERQSAVTSAAEIAATNTNTALSTSITAQDVIDYLAAANIASLLPGDGCVWQDSAGSTVAGVGDPVGRIAAWNGIVLGDQSNSTDKPSLDSSGVVSIDRTTVIDFTLDVATFTSAEAFVAANPAITNDGLANHQSRLWHFGSGSPIDWHPYGVGNKIYESFFLTSRQNTSGEVLALYNPFIYNPSINGSGAYTWRVNNALVRSATGTFNKTLGSPNLISATSQGYDGTFRMIGVSQQVNATQRRAIHEFINTYLSLGLTL